MPEESKEIKIPGELPILPLKGQVIFPYLIVPLVISNEKMIKLTDEALLGNKIIGLCTQLRQDTDEPKEDEIYPVGTAALIIKMLRFPDGSIRILVQGLNRIKITKFVQSEPYLMAKVEVLKEKGRKSIEAEALMRNVVSLFQKIISLAPYLPDELQAVSLNIEDSGKMADLIASNLNLTIAERQQILETIDPKDRLQKLIPLLSKELSILELGDKIRNQVKTEMDKDQRDYFLREQMKAIQRELGEGDEHSLEVGNLRKKVEKANLSPEALKAAQEELDRLARMPPHAAEYTVSRTYIDWLVKLPWSVSTTDSLDVAAARKILDEDHYDLEKVKDRIIEYLAVRKLKGDAKGPILCFVGPPGVGKTSLGRSIARALGRKFYRISLGGIRDEAEIRGFRRTYIGSMPGRIIQGLKHTETNNPVFMLDEVDKIGLDFRGDPSAALLEVLDPEQNFSFADHYLDVPFDLSKVMFITTANVMDPIPSALKDRMEVLELPGYIEEEKLHIALKYLVPRQIKENGLTEGHIKFSDQSISQIISQYTREAGVRNLEREIATICRKVAKDVASGDKTKKTVTPQSLHKYLGPQKVFPEVAERTGEVGMATGLAWTPVGGEILFIEATKMLGKKGLSLTGSLGEVMKESAQAALSYIRSKSKIYKIDPRFFEKFDIHIHVPSGAIPKDGPSAGVTMATALISLLTDRPVKANLAMTGEITLRGKVMPVGGIKEKVIAAKRAGIREIIMPEQNRKDLEEVPDHVRKNLKFHFVSNIESVAQIAFGPKIRKGR
ncbi:MAG: endopeptidase La [Candidatus Edwardsbacteria bacterium RifOxyA12_full_54_48]|nr:MAG: endopeptidase La [Candidatus Edwardsbacteria bacterium RifOxyC12_full_54_24]OGF08698.1 MAG: endopeptidase La [Candidatus Edwardsbacteria bacterium RifOxyA12_full_54_48]OGF11340.1 MAG: endopeptidase La [Candidatus Edwardsbacteria bacterium GWE2_54_12]OGJ18155.1 MAG: endopeptidase La [Candidatus Edwardsbacteria bacterium RifOxyB12_full_52_30]HAD82956.1 endopeptidase La [Candidatus Edwardsbacteria bacterium]